MTPGAEPFGIGGTWLRPLHATAAALLRHENRLPDTLLLFADALLEVAEEHRAAGDVLDAADIEGLARHVQQAAATGR